MLRIANSGNKRDIDDVNGLPDKLEKNMNELKNYLGLTEEQFEELDADTNLSGEMIYPYFSTFQNMSLMKNIRCHCLEGREINQRYTNRGR